MWYAPVTGLQDGTLTRMCPRQDLVDHYKLELNWSGGLVLLLFPHPGSGFCFFLESCLLVQVRWWQTLFTSTGFCFFVFSCHFRVGDTRFIFFFSIRNMSDVLWIIVWFYVYQVCSRLMHRVLLSWSIFFEQKRTVTFLLNVFSRDLIF